MQSSPAAVGAYLLKKCPFIFSLYYSFSSFVFTQYLIILQVYHKFRLKASCFNREQSSLLQRGEIRKPIFLLNLLVCRLNHRRRVDRPLLRFRVLQRGCTQNRTSGCQAKWQCGPVSSQAIHIALS